MLRYHCTLPLVGPITSRDTVGNEPNSAIKVHAMETDAESITYAVEEGKANPNSLGNFERS